MHKRMQKCLTIADLECAARRRVPRMFFEYVDSGSWTCSTYKANSRDFKDILFRQRIAVDMTDRVLASSLVGQTVSMPVALAPTGLCGMNYADGEILANRAATAAGVPFTLSTMSICSIEDVAASGGAPFWFQVYMLKDRKFMEKLIERAKEARCSALVLTLDLQILGQRHNDIRNGLSAPPTINLDTVLQFLTKPSWCMNMLTTKRRSFRNIVGHATGVSDTASLSTWAAEQFDPSLNWKDVDWVRKQWPGKLIIKGILDPEDAKAAVAHGADALVVSNHGGRQLDSAPSSISSLVPIVRAVGEETEIHLDGGIRSGQDVLKAMCLGAKGVYVGRSYLYGLGAGGEHGVSRALEIIRKELDVTMALCGERDLRVVGHHNLARVPSWAEE